MAFRVYPRENLAIQASRPGEGCRLGIVATVRYNLCDDMTFKESMATICANLYLSNARYSKEAVKLIILRKLQQKRDLRARMADNAM